jgi:hypothetical protein
MQDHRAERGLAVGIDRVVALELQEQERRAVADVADVLPGEIDRGLVVVEPADGPVGQIADLAVEAQFLAEEVEAQIVVAGPGDVRIGREIIVRAESLLVLAIGGDRDQLEIVGQANRRLLETPQPENTVLRGIE